MATVLALTRTCDEVVSVRLFDVANRGVYPTSSAVASIYPATPQLVIEGDHRGDVHVIRLLGELDLTNAPDVWDRLCAEKCSTLQVDLSGTTFCDAKGLSALLGAKRKRERDGCRVSLLGARGIVRRVFEVTGNSDQLDD